MIKAMINHPHHLNLVTSNRSFHSTNYLSDQADLINPAAIVALIHWADVNPSASATWSISLTVSPLISILITVST